MEVQFGPNSVDEPNLLYKLQRKIKVFETTNPLPNRGYNLVTCSSKYGIVFVGSPDAVLLVFYLKDLIDKESEPPHLSVTLQEAATHIAVNSDYELLAVSGSHLLCIYKVIDFQNQNVSPSVCIKYDTNPTTFVSALQWNPCIPDNIAVAFFDGTLFVSQVNTNQVKKVQSKARCICWSPKGKQLVTGNSDGTLSQYKPDLTPAKMVAPPKLFDGAPVEALSIYWISTFQFAVVYKHASDNSRPAVTIVNTPKAPSQPACLNYEDICYSMGSNRPWYYYLQGIAQWNLILSSSSNSMEIATLGSADGANWLQWCQPDEARPELPLTNKKQDNFPIGVSIDTCAIHQLPWGENETLPHMPLLHVVSQTGLLTIFNIVNLKKEAIQVCFPSQQLVLPASAMTSEVVGQQTPAAPEPVTIATPVPSKPHPLETQEQPQAPQVMQPAFSNAAAPQLSSLLTSAPKPFNIQQSPMPPGLTTATPTPVAESKKVETKPAVSIPQPQASLSQTKATIQPPKQTTQAQEVNAALKIEQGRMNKLKADQELRNMLVKEVNDFQMDLYKFSVKTREVQIKLQKDLNAINSNFNFQSLDCENLKKDCSLEVLHAVIVQLKLELVRTCAIVAEARTYAETKEQQQWQQLDPLTTKRMASVRQLACYIQTQLEQAQKALDYKWNEMRSKDPKLNKPGQRMIRPVLDDVYQPLVKQQEILSRQQAVLKTLRHTLNECDSSPVFKSASLLRSTPFRNKDPLSKLTRNILNMSIEPQNNKGKDALLTPHKLDALRDMLSNHKPVKIKPVNVEIRQRLEAMKLNYERSVKEKTLQDNVQAIKVKTEPLPQQSHAVLPVSLQSEIVTVKPDLLSKQPIAKQPIASIQNFTPTGNVKPTVPGLNNVVRTLFTDETKSEPILQQPQVQPQTVNQSLFSFGPPASITASANTRSILKDMLQNKQANVTAKNDANTFMGQKICSPTVFAAPTVPVAPIQPPAPAFTSKPISDITNMFNKFTPQPFTPDSGPEPQTPQISIPKQKSVESSGPISITTNKPLEAKETVKPMTNLFGMATSTPLPTNSQNVPDVLKDSTSVKADTNTVAKPIPKDVEKSKQNLQTKTNEQKPQVLENVKQTETKTDITMSLTTSDNKSAEIDTTASNVKNEPQSPIDTKPENKVPEKTNAPANFTASSIFAAANATAATALKSQSVFGTASSPTSVSQTSIFGTTTLPAASSSNTATISASPSVIFGSAVASQATTTTTKTTQSSSIFASVTPTTTITASSIFNSTSGSIFGTTTSSAQSTPSSIFATSTTQSVVSTAESKPSVFSTPTPASPSSVFGAAVSATQSSFSSPTTSTFATTTVQSPFSTTSSVFGTASSTQAGSVFANVITTAQSIFGANVTTSQSVFSTTTATSQSVFQPTTTTQSVFGSATSVFGSPTATTQSMFGATTTTQASVFGTAVTSQSSVFGATSAPVFGATTTQTSVFGTTTTPAQSSVFGSPQTTQASLFGNPVQTGNTSVFGTLPATTAQSGSVFGGAEANLFAAASISTTTASPTTGSIFGGGSSGSVFGGENKNIFGGKTSFSQSNPTATAIFGGNTAFGQKSADANNFWANNNANTNTNAGSGFGTSAFSQRATTQASSIFGGSTGGSFSSPAGGQAFASPQQSSIFGSPQQQTAPAFGTSSAFGAKPAFGQSAGFAGGFSKSPTGGFGASPTFGSGATFGGSAFGGTSPSKVFGGGGASPGFGSPTQSNATFESLATQNTLTFGNLAQQSGTPPQQQPTFNTSPSFTGWRG